MVEPEDGLVVFRNGFQYILKRFEVTARLLKTGVARFGEEAGAGFPPSLGTKATRSGPLVHQVPINGYLARYRGFAQRSGDGFPVSDVKHGAGSTSRFYP